MSYSRYSKRPFIQPVRKINSASSDILHEYKSPENIDNLAYKYYGNATYGWVIMLANREYPFEFAIPYGVTLRIPFPLERVFQEWGINNDN